MNSTPPILSLLERRDDENLQMALASFRVNGVIKYEKSLAIPMDQRIPELTKTPDGRKKVSIAIAASLLSAFQHIDKAKMAAATIREISEAIIDSSQEDQLAIEDVLLFLKELLIGKFGKIRDNLDMPSFFEYFEQYRDKRYQTLEAIRYEEHLNQKSLGHAPRSSGDLILKRDEDPCGVLDLMHTYYQKSDEE
jgi:hypothetical protein